MHVPTSMNRPRLLTASFLVAAIVTADADDCNRTLQPAVTSFVQSSGHKFVSDQVFSAFWQQAKPRS
jgi:hypothetical protein